MLGEAKLVFSANLQETLGISWYEGALVDTIPMVPDRLSYSEMALPEFKYNSDWTIDYDSYMQNRDKVVKQIVEYMENYKDFLPSIQKQVTKLHKEFFSGKELYRVIADEDDDLTYTVKLDSLDDCIPVSYEAGATVGGPSTITLTTPTNDDLSYTFDTTYAGDFGQVHRSSASRKYV